MAGYAARDRPSEGTLHDIWAKALAFEDATGKQSVLVTADIIRVPKAFSERIRDRVEEKFRLFFSFLPFSYPYGCKKCAEHSKSPVARILPEHIEAG